MSNLASLLPHLVLLSLLVYFFVQGYPMLAGNVCRFLSPRIQHPVVISTPEVMSFSSQSNFLIAIEYVSSRL